MDRDMTLSEGLNKPTEHHHKDLSGSRTVIIAAILIDRLPTTHSKATR